MVAFRYTVSNPLFAQGYDVVLSFVSFHTEQDYDQLTAYLPDGSHGGLLKVLKNILDSAQATDTLSTGP